MKRISGIGLKDVQAVYSGPEGSLWELLMGEQIHMGGFRSSMQLADAAGIGAASEGVDLCCCSGAGMRFLVRFRQVARMCGVDATPTVVEVGRKRCAEAGLADRISFQLADVCKTGLPAESVDFVWGEDAWCYVEDKPALIAEAARLLRPGGVIAFTDWVEAGPGLTGAEAERFLRFMKFPNIQDISGYQQLLERSGFRGVQARDTGRFAPCVDLYVRMLNEQLAGDALRLIGFDANVLEAVLAEMRFTVRLARDGKLAQAMFVAREP